MEPRILPCNYRITKIIIVALLLLILTREVAQAQGGYPEPTDSYINDYAGLLNGNDKKNTEQLLIDLRQTHGIEATVLTIGSLADYDTGDETIEAFATNLFNTWGIGDREKNNGVLLLVSVNDRQMRIELGSGYENAYNEAMQEVINEHIIPSFKGGNFSRGIYRGVRAIVGQLTGEWPPDRSVSNTASSSANTSNRSENSTTSPAHSSLSSNSTRSINTSTSPNTNSGLPWGWLLGGGAVTAGAAGLGWRRYLRYRKRPCPDCQTQMIRLDEVSDDVHLDSGQKLEELLSSIDYDVWKCPNCNFHTIIGYKNWFSGLSKCPQCRYRTLKTTSTILDHPTETSTGSQRVTKDCQNCSYHDEDIVILPRKTRSDSSSSSSFGSSSSGGSSFGGGSSSGGGASGSW